jgi:hypothetical protein
MRTTQTPKQFTETDPQVRDSPVYWFFILDASRERGHFDLAAEAKKNLERLGVSVRYRRPARGAKSHARA